MLILFVILYLLVSIGIGLYAATRVKNSKDYVVAGRSLPLYIVVATTFATWFGSETVLGISATFVSDGLGGVVEDPFGASLCLIFVGMFFAGKLYKMALLTISDYYRQRYSRTVEIMSGVAIILSYLGWVAAQITALGLVFHLLAPEHLSQTGGMLLGTGIVLSYTLFGGMWSVALTDFFQMIIIAAGLLFIAWYASDMVGGAGVVIDHAASLDLFNFFPAPNAHDIVFFIGAALTMMLGSIPQQDVFQRVMSAKDAKTAQRGPIIGGSLYFLFAFIPMFIVVSSLLIMPEEAATLLAEDSQKLLPILILEHMPLVAQIFFFGALLSAIMSTASATLLAPSVTFTENILKNMLRMDDRHFLRATRIAVVVFTACVLTYAIVMQGSSIYELVANAYKVTLVSAFVPLVMGLYWKRADNQGALLSMVFGIVTWVLFELLMPDAFPPQLAGLIMAFAGMIIGSLMPNLIPPPRTAHHHAHGPAGHGDHSGKHS